MALAAASVVGAAGALGMAAPAWAHPSPTAEISIQPASGA